MVWVWPVRLDQTPLFLITCMLDPVPVVLTLASPGLCHMWYLPWLDWDVSGLWASALAWPELVPDSAWVGPKKHCLPSRPNCHIQCLLWSVPKCMDAVPTLGPMLHVVHALDQTEWAFLTHRVSIQSGQGRHHGCWEWSWPGPWPTLGVGDVIYLTGLNGRW